MSDPAKENARDRWGEINKELDALKKLVESPDSRKGLDYEKWQRLTGRLKDLKYDGLKDIPGPYDTKLIEWYARLSELDLFIDELNEEFQKVDGPDSPVWKEILNRIKDAKKAKEKLEKFLE